MAEKIIIPQTGSKAVRYEALAKQLARMVRREPNMIANLANAAALLRQACGFFWVGFYLREGESELVLGPFQGPVACTRIGYGKGYYDRAITELRPLATVGIGYAAQEIPAVPDEPHDRSLDWIVTENETIRCA